MLYGRLSVGHVRQSLWYCVKIDASGQQPIHPCVYLRFCDCHHRLHPDSNELLQQGFKPIPYLYVSITSSHSRDLLTFEKRKPSLLCYIHNRNTVCLLHPLPWFQHHRCRQHHLPTQRLLGHFHRSVSAQSIAGRSQRSQTSQWSRI